jgi:hypothetical protein
MKSLLFIFVSTIVVLLGCNKESNNSLTGKWSVSSFENLETGEIVFDSLMLLSSTFSQQIILELKDNGSTGKISGKTLANTLSGEYRLGNRNRIGFSIGGSKVGENSRFSNKFWSDFMLAERYELNDNGFGLTLFYNNDRQVIKLFKL